MSQSYLEWRQTDPRYNREQAWTAERFPKATYHYFEECGCLVCALAAMLRHYRIERTADEGLFNPWILNQRLIDCGAFGPEADLELSLVDRLYPLEYLGAVSYSKDALTQVADDGLPCLVTVPGVNAAVHFTALLGVLSDDAVVLDPLCGERNLSSYDQVHDIRVFRPRVSG